MLLVAPVAAVVALALPWAVQPAEALDPGPQPVISLLESLAGTAATVGGALEVTSAATTVGLVGVAGAAGFGAGYYGSSLVASWLFDDPDEAGAQPNTGLARGYTNSAGGAYDPLGAGTWRAAGSCRAASAPGAFDPAASGSWSNVFAPTCFSVGNTVTPAQTSARVLLAMPAWRCLVANCADAVKVVAIISQTASQTLSGAGSFAGFSGTAGASASHNVTASPSTGFLYYGWDVWYDAAQIEFDPPPARSLATTTTCRDLGTGSTTASTSVSADFYGQSGSVNLAGAIGSCGTGSTATEVTIEKCDAGGANCSTVLTHWTADPAVSHPEETDPYRDCLPGGSAAPCTVTIWKGTPSGYKECDESTDCVTFDPEQTFPADSWKCMWGTHVVPVGECSPLKSWTDTTGVNEEIDPDPPPEPGVGTVTDPEPSATASPSAPVQPSEGTNPTTPVDPQPPTDPAEAASSSCWGTGWSWNPVSWVFVPVKCALAWAFIPTDAPSFHDVPSPLPAGWVPSFPSLSDGACGQVTMPRLDMTKMIGEVGPFDLVNTCDAPWPLARKLTYNGLLAAALIGVGWAGFRAVMTALGMGVDVASGGGDEE